MTPDHWKIIEASAGPGVPLLGEAQCALLDKVQARLALTDKDFGRFLIVLGKILPAGGPGAKLPNISAKLSNPTMKLHPTAALTLVGWYLMAPPERPGASIEPALSAPLARWESMGSYHTAKQCMDVKMHVFDQARLPDGAPERPSRAAKSIATDDPRRKEK